VRDFLGGKDTIPPTGTRVRGSRCYPTGQQRRVHVDVNKKREERREKRERESARARKSVYEWELSMPSLLPRYPTPTPLCQPASSMSSAVHSGQDVCMCACVEIWTRQLVHASARSPDALFMARLLTLPAACPPPSIHPHFSFASVHVL